MAPKEYQLLPICREAVTAAHTGVMERIFGSLADIKKPIVKVRTMIFGSMIQLQITGLGLRGIKDHMRVLYMEQKGWQLLPTSQEAATQWPGGLTMQQTYGY